MNTIVTIAGARGCRRLNHVLAALALALAGGAAWSQDVVSVPAAHLHHAEGSVAYAPSGDKEWHDVQPRRLLKRGDRLWVDRGSRAEIQAGGHAVRLNGETQLVLENVGETATQLSLTQGSVVATVTGMKPGDSFEVGTPNLAFRARQPGDYRIDVDAKQGFTRIVVLSGLAVVYGEKGEAMEVRNGQRAVFRERSLTRVLQPAFAASDDFDRWALARRRGEPTVSMPSVAQSAPTPAPTTALVNKGKDIVIAGPATGLPGSRLAAAQQSAPALPPVAAVVPPQAPKAQAIPNATPATPVAVPLRVTAETGPTPAQQAEAQARAKAQADADARARMQAERQRLAQQRADDDRRAAQVRAESDRRAAALEARRTEERRRSTVAAKRAEDDRRHQVAKKEQESKRAAAARREDERRALQAKKAAEDKRVAAARKAEAQRIADARRAQLARLQEQARREEQSAQARREQQARRAEEERRDELARREDQARREEDLRRQRALADQARRDQERRDQEVWLRQQQVQPAPYQYQPQPVRPAPMGVPARRVS